MVAAKTTVRVQRLRGERQRDCVIVEWNLHLLQHGMEEATMAGRFMGVGCTRYYLFLLSSCFIRALFSFIISVQYSSPVNLHLDAGIWEEMLLLF